MHLSLLKFGLASSLLFSIACHATNDPANSCGRISVFNIVPRSEHLYPATIIEIDGHTPGTKLQDSYRVTTGSHSLLVGENIDPRDISGSNNSRPRRNQYKELKINVASGVTYTVAARLNADKSVNEDHAQYWDPIVWKETPESCD